MLRLPRLLRHPQMCGNMAASLLSQIYRLFVGIDEQFQKDASTGCNARLSVLASSLLSCREGHKARRGIFSPGAAYNLGNKRDLDRIIGVLSE